jgi:hypothetical protein
MNTTTKSRKKLHYTDGRGFAVTACGKSLHGWQGSATPIATTDYRAVECKACRRKKA